MNQMTPTDALAGLMGLMMLLPLLMLGFLLVSQGFWIWMLVDCATNRRLIGNGKIVWVLVVVFTNWIGALVYFFAARPKRFQVAPPLPPPVQSAHRHPPPIPPKPAATQQTSTGVN